MEQEREDPEAALRRMWTNQGVPQDKQDELIRGVIAKASARVSGQPVRREGGEMQRKPMMRTIEICIALVLATGCAWLLYQDDAGADYETVPRVVDVRAVRVSKEGCPVGYGSPEPIPNSDWVRCYWKEAR